MNNFPYREVKVIDPATGVIFSFEDVENIEEVRRIQAARYEILEYIK
jgi:hypothetical protein